LIGLYELYNWEVREVSYVSEKMLSWLCFLHPIWYNHIYKLETFALYPTRRSMPFTIRKLSHQEGEALQKKYNII
jgi:hypothetical protein